MRNGMSIPASGASRAKRAKPPSGWTKSFCISTISSADLSMSGPIIMHPCASPLSHEPRAAPAATDESIVLKIRTPSHAVDRNFTRYFATDHCSLA